MTSPAFIDGQVPTDDPRTSSFYRSSLPQATWHPDRDSRLVDLSRDQRVLHVGCTDAPLTQEKLRVGELLHTKLKHASSEVVGVDIDGEGLELLRKRVGGRYLHADATDASTMTPVLADLRPTLIVAADVIEHVADVGRFVSALATCARETEAPCRLVVSTPNGLSVRTPLLTCAGMELIHPDHRVVYTPASLGRTLADGGFRVTGWMTYSITLGPGRLRWGFDVAARAASRIRPHLADGLIAVADLGPATQDAMPSSSR